MKKRRAKGGNETRGRRGEEKWVVLERERKRERKKQNRKEVEGEKK